MSGTLNFELNNWSDADALLKQAKTILESLSMAVGEEEGALFKHKIEEITPSLRYCAYNIGDTSAKDDLLAMRTGRGADTDLTSLIMQTREQQAATLQVSGKLKRNFLACSLLN